MLQMEHSCLWFQFLGDDILHKGNWRGNEEQANLHHHTSPSPILCKKLKIEKPRKIRNSRLLHINMKTKIIFKENLEFLKKSMIL
jgi:hypothetical protein